MPIKYFVLSIVLSSIFVSPALAHAPVVERPLLETKEQMVAYATTKALEARISPATVLAVIQCESTWVPTARGDGGHSRGLVQIHDQYHDIPDELADDPQFAIGFLVDALADGKGDMWTCYRNL